ncbi:MAG: DUF559 domain-containing protein [Bacteroidales bacterium]|jgi:very-short-patch-repair endonuclease/REP element-mobilizing transposase RayT|nr:DUF559 domain-containing protein [Bacteroidales bacterium]
MSFFQQSILRKHIVANADKISQAYKLYIAYFHNVVIQENIRNSKEEQFQEGFLRELFVKILGYTLNPTPNFNLITEQKNEINSKKADGAILVGGEVLGVIGLKDTKTTDLKNIENQAFGYKNNNRKAIYVITSNFEKLRFYIENAIDFVEFNLFALTESDFALLWICLAYENIAKNLPKQIKSESVSKEDQITKELYKDYSAFKRALFADLCEQNPNYDKLTLFKKSQKLLDRLLFIFFAEDGDLLPPNSVVEIVKQWELLKDNDAYFPLYERLKKYFGYLDTGYKGKKRDIFAYNGGLFKPDELLDSVVISDKILHDHCLKLAEYNFKSEIDVNILGHIFENSLTEIEEVANEITKGEKQASKRKKDGVFYTPRYITAYIVENTICKLCADKKAKLEIDEQEYFADKKRQKETKKLLNDKLETYRSWLLSLTICDPACGSGAFLNAALDFLMAEHRLIDEMTAKLLGESIVFSNIENAILENNLYGVDINEESVEIARLSLWLRTAKPNRKLNSLNDNIKCGNSLISPSPPTPFQNGEVSRTVEVQLPPQLLANARDLRKNQTEAEKFLWQILRNRQLNNLKFRRQHPLCVGFILDFYCAEAKLGIELDGGYHNSAEQQAHDDERTKIINEYGINIIRFTNEEVLQDVENTLKKIATAFLSPSPAGRGVGGEEKAFDWHKEFPQVFTEKEKKAFHVTTAVHDSRTSQRMIDYKVREMRAKYNKGVNPVAYADPRFMTEEDNTIITKTIAEIVKEDKLNVLAYNVCRDHLHILLVCEEDELDKIVGKIKGKTARACNLYKGINPLVQKEGACSVPFWAQKFYRKEILDERQLYNTIEYIENNRIKHELPPLGIDTTSKGTCPIVCDIEHAFRTEYKGGFDVVIGNPPYGAKIDKVQINYLSEKYAHWGISAAFNDTYFVFYAFALEKILKTGGYLGFITPNTWRLIDNAKLFRKVLFNNFQICQIIQHSNKVFEDATVDCDTAIIRKSNIRNNVYIQFFNTSVQTNEHFVSQEKLLEQDFINLFLTQIDYDLKAKIAEQSVFVKDELIIKNGVKPYEKGKGKPAQTEQTMKEKPFTSEIKKDNSFSPLIGGSLFQKYKLLWNNDSWIQYGEWLAAPREKEIFETEEKLIFRQTSDSIIGTLIGKGFIMRNNTHIILNKENSEYDLKYVLSLLNSKLINWYYWTINPEKGEAMAEVKTFHLGLLPIKNISENEQQPFITLADKMLSLNTELQTKRQCFLKRLADNFAGIKITGKIEIFDELDFAQLLAELKKQKIILTLKQQDEWEEYFSDYKTECNKLSSEISTTDKEIDGMVYELYGLTEEEIKIIEKS